VNRGLSIKLAKQYVASFYLPGCRFDFDVWYGIADLRPELAFRVTDAYVEQRVVIGGEAFSVTLHAEPPSEPVLLDLAPRAVALAGLER